MMNKKYIYPIILAIIHFLITTICRIDMLFFDIPKSISTYYFTKISYFIFLSLVWCFVFWVYEKYKSGDKLIIRGTHVFCCYALITTILLILVWPGIWSYWDDIVTLTNFDTHYTFDSWQHILTSYFHIIFAQILPFPGGIILIQNFIVSACVAFIVTKLETTYNIYLKNKFLDTIVKFIPFLSFPILRYQFSGYRVGLYVYIELLALIILLCSIKDEKEWSFGYSILFSFAVVVAATWRSESIFYLPIAIISVLLMKNNVLNILKKILITIFIVIFFSGVNFAQKKFLHSNNYQLLSTLCQCVTLVRNANQEEDYKEINNISKIIDLNVVKNNPDADGEELFFYNNLVKDNYKKYELNDFYKSIIILSWKYPKIIFNERWYLFKQITAFTSSYTNDCNLSGTKASAVIWHDDLLAKRLKYQRIASKITSVIIFKSGNFILNTPINKDLRKNIISIIGCENANKKLPIYKIIWTPVIPMIILGLFFICLLFTKKWREAFIFCSTIFKFPVIFLMAPGPYFMYYLSFYLQGYLILIWLLIVLINRIRIKHNEQ